MRARGAAAGGGNTGLDSGGDRGEAEPPEITPEPGDVGEPGGVEPAPELTPEPDGIGAGETGPSGARPGPREEAPDPGE